MGKRIVIEKGYIKSGVSYKDFQENRTGWICNDMGSMYAAWILDERGEQVGKDTCSQNIEQFFQKLHVMLGRMSIN